MTDKEATVYVVDVGKSMGEKRGGRDESDLDWCMRYVWDKITTTVATGRKTLYVGVVGLRTDGTKVNLDDDEGYEHVSILQPLSQICMPQVRNLRDQMRPSKTNKGDTMSAVVVAMQMISDHCRKLKYVRRIVLVTNGRGSLDPDDLGDISNKLKAENIEFVVLGADFDDPEYGVKEEDKDPDKAVNEAILRQFADDCDGVFGTMAQAIDELDIPRVKPVRPIPGYKGPLILGSGDSAMEIPIERYPRIMQARPPTASSYVHRSDLAPGESSQIQSSATVAGNDDGPQTDHDSLAAVKQATAFHVAEEGAPGGKRDVDREDLSRGYNYGSTAVPISESESDIVELKTEAALDIIGFIPADKFERYMQMSRTNTIIAQKANDKASMALSSLIHALYELETFAVARFVAKDMKPPVIVVLAPEISADHECLVDSELPFAEDMRGYRFPPLDRVVTVSGKTIEEHRNLPSKDLVSAMSDYVDSMDLSEAGQDEEGKPAEFAPFEDVYSPVLHRVQQAVRWRAVRPMDDLPPPPNILTRYMYPPEHVLKPATAKLDALIKAADVKRVPPKQKGRKRTREFEEPLSGLNINALLGDSRPKKAKITSENAVPEFKQALSAVEDPTAIEGIADQLAKIIHGYIKESMGDRDYGRAVEAIRVFKEEMVDLEEPRIFNDFLKELKEKITNGELGGDRREIWYLVKVNRLGLIDKKTSELSDVSEEEAKTVSRSSDFPRLCLTCTQFMSTK
ncbi:putative Ku family DNA helicase [Phyllosticta paracitricarpa]|uniref:ATP-dependent DNA helicase II subunit 2 n=1 Tax=Phyllosticta paracitricarpa TaxID=2016321 RepID=A0ABR1NIM9_9PEZI